MTQIFQKIFFTQNVIIVVGGMVDSCLGGHFVPPLSIFFSVPPYQPPMMELLGVMYCPGTTLTIPIINKNSHPCRRLETAQMHKPLIFGILAILNHFLHTYLYGNTHHGQGN